MFMLEEESMPSKKVIEVFDSFENAERKTWLEIAMDVKWLKNGKANQITILPQTKHRRTL